MQKWEYKKVYIGADINSDPTCNLKMQDLGKEGWELVAVNDRLAYFKRPIEE